MDIRNRALRLASDQKMIAGVQQLLAQLPAVPVGSQSVTPADIVKVFQTRIDTTNAAVKAEAARAAAVKADRDELAKTAAFVSSFRRMVQGMFSQSPDLLATFGLSPAKVNPPDAAKKAAAVAKGLATRKARGTLGKKARLAIHGQVPVPPAAPKA